ncbi:MAG: sulfur oxidation c-type cytochrome SoxX [Betaproteobacteria bacterium]|nr:MAG: sulfur oxidation c-type cytochrome SoxX [Betaproteobacteria bacterium]
MAILALAGCAQQVPGRAMLDQSVGSLDEPLTSEPPDATRGLALVQGRDGNCLLCHAIPETGARFMGNLGPSLSGVGSRMSAGQLRLRLVDSLRLNPNSIMPSYFKTEGLNQVAETWRGKTILSAQQIEDTIAYLLTLR